MGPESTVDISIKANNNQIEMTIIYFELRGTRIFRREQEPEETRRWKSTLGFLSISSDEI